MYSGQLTIDKTFIGRDAELNHITTIIHSNQNSKILVHGNIGVGKTTLTNYLRYLEKNRETFTPLGEINVQQHWNPEQFMFATIQSLYLSIIRTELDKKFPKHLIDKLHVQFGIKRGSTRGVGASLAGFGGNVTQAESYGAYPLNAFELKEIMQDIIEQLSDLGHERTIIHYNNLELAADDAKSLQKLFNGIREFVDIEGAHFIFVGSNQFVQMVQGDSRLRDIFHHRVVVEPFDFKTIEKIIRRRIDILRIPTFESKLEDLVDYDSLRRLHAIYDGNLRGIMGALCEAMYSVSQNDPMTLTRGVLDDTLFLLAKEKFLNKINNNEQKVLRVIVNNGEVTNKEISQTLSMLPQNVTAALKVLKELNAIYLAREEGRERVYSPTSDALWLKLHSDDVAVSNE